MATSYSKDVTAYAVANLIDELENDASDWQIQAVTSTGTKAVVCTSKIAYTNTTFGLDSGETVSIDIDAGSSVSAIQLVYNDGSNTIMHSETVDETFTYGGSYVINGYTITLVAS